MLVQVGAVGFVKVKVKDGQYEKWKHYSKQALTDEERDNGHVLLCKTYPLSHLQVELVN